MATITHVEHFWSGCAFVSIRKLKWPWKTKPYLKKRIVTFKLVASPFHVKKDGQRKQSEATKKKK